MNNRNRISISITDVSRTRYFTIKQSTKRNVLVGLVLGLCAIPALSGYIVWQHKRASGSDARIFDLEHQVGKLEIHNGLLIEQVAAYNELARTIERELVEIARVGGVEGHHVAASAHEYGNSPQQLANRLLALRNFYREKEEEYTEIRRRVEKAEGVIGREGKPAEGASLQVDWEKRMEELEIGARLEHLLHSDLPSGFPTANRKITSEFGNRIHPVTKIYGFHNGTDLRSPIGAKVRATANGVVRSADTKRYSGKRIVIEHSYGFETYYAHLHKLLVEPGTVVRKGDVIAISGNTGRSDGPHLHYEVRYLGKPLNPKSFLQWEFGTHDIFKEVEAIDWGPLVDMMQRRNSPGQEVQLSQVGPEVPSNN